MRIRLSKLILPPVCIVALLLFSYSVIQPDSTTAQTSYVSNLPSGYTVYSGQLGMGKACSCSTGGITGAPSPPPPCARSFCFGSSNTRYGSINTSIQGIKSTICGGGAGPPCFQLDGDDALVILGSMSPVQSITYYSFTAYQSFTANPQARNNYSEVRSSIGLGLNKTNLKLGNDGGYVLVLTASTNTFRIIKNALIATGVPDRIINSYYIPASVANLGTSNYPDQLSLLLRLTPQSETEKKLVDTFVNQTAPVTQVSFVKGPGVNGNVTFDDVPKWEDTLRTNDIESRVGLDQKLATLEQSVTSTYAKQGYKLRASLKENLLHTDASVCRTKFRTCNYDAPDALYTTFLCNFSPISVRTGNCNFQLTTNSDDVLMLLGVNHSLVGKKALAAYISEESRPTPGSQSQDGTFAYVGLYTQGSANQYLRGIDGRRDNNLYAVKIARNCGNSPFCAAVPYTISL